MSEHASSGKSENRTVEISLGLIVVVGSYMYIHETLLQKHLFDVLIAVFAFGAGLVFLYRYYK